jgi:predicted nuclease with TOPRIM domain
MASEKVLTALGELHEQLEKLLPAIRHVEMAQEVTSNLHSITDKYKSLMDELDRKEGDLSKLRDRVEQYYRTVERINFPNRLDKLDNNVAAATLASQAFQNRIENLERNIADRLKDGFERLAELQNKQQTQTYFTWTVVVLAAIVVIFVLKH